MLHGEMSTDQKGRVSATLHRGRSQCMDHKDCSSAVLYHQADDMTTATHLQSGVTSYLGCSTNVTSPAMLTRLLQVHTSVRCQDINKF